MSNATDMAACPFCARDVDADLVVYGGKCPSCFGEIPGEEAPTDPGEEKKAAEHKAVAAKVQSSKRLPILLATFVSLAVVGATVFFVVSNLMVAPMPVLNLDDAEYEMGGTLVAWEEPKAAVVQPAKVKTGPKTAAAPTGPTSTNPYAGIDGGKLLGEDGAAGAVAGSTGPSAPGESGPRKVGPSGPLTPEAGTVADPKAIGGTAGPSSLDPQVTVARRVQLGVVLEDDNQIIDMIKAVMQTELPKLRSCYEGRLKQNESLSGSWLLEFTVKGNGKVGGAVASGKEVADSELEACVVAKVNGWQFQPIKQDQPVRKTLTFRPL